MHNISPTCSCMAARLVSITAFVSPAGYCDTTSRRCDATHEGLGLEPFPCIMDMNTVIPSMDVDFQTKRWAMYTVLRCARFLLLIMILDFPRSSDDSRSPSVFVECSQRPTPYSGLRVPMENFILFTFKNLSIH